MSLTILVGYSMHEFSRSAKEGKEKIMRPRYQSTTFFQIAVSAVLTVLFALPASAVTRPRESWLNGGWQIWIEAGDFDRRNNETAVMLGSAAPKAELAKSWLSEDIIIAQNLNGYVEYDFESPLAGDAYIYCRVMDFNMGASSNSWFVVLNSDDHASQGTRIGTTEQQWVWNSATSPTKLGQGKNTIRVVPREAAPGSETLMDILVVSTVAFEPTAEVFNNATSYGDIPVIVEGKIVSPGEQFTVDISARLRENSLHRFSFDLAFDPSILQAVGVKEGTLLSESGARGTVWESPEVDNEKGVIRNIECRLPVRGTQTSRTGKQGAAEKSGTLAVVTFKALHRGRSGISLRNLHLFAADNAEITAGTQEGWVDSFSHGSISGVVRDAQTKMPIPKARIEVSRYGSSSELFTYSDGAGKYILNGVPVGTVDVTASVNTGQSELKDWRLDVRLRQGKHQTLNLALRHTVSISGTLLMLDDTTPHVAAVVQAVTPSPDGKGEPTVVATKLTDERGGYQFINLKSGRYKVRCYTLDGYLYYREGGNSALDIRHVLLQGVPLLPPEPCVPFMRTRLSSQIS